MAQRRLYEYLATLLGAWAGKHVVCVGEDLEPGDFSPGLFSKKEE